jgi:hypothetical protein
MCAGCNNPRQFTGGNGSIYNDGYSSLSAKPNTNNVGSMAKDGADNGSGAGPGAKLIEFEGK